VQGKRLTRAQSAGKQAHPASVAAAATGGAEAGPSSRPPGGYLRLYLEEGEAAADTAAAAAAAAGTCQPRHRRQRAKAGAKSQAQEGVLVATLGNRPGCTCGPAVPPPPRVQSQHSSSRFLPSTCLVTFLCLFGPVTHDPLPPPAL
jgi:hypothetical protein